ncbi:ribonuclease [Sphingomonas sp. SUN019]|uniref:ribonuclease n=1 Tax=Sphingomonas sp. SUN019 TaxID=2937788 RepID=UPI00216405D0|nr:ribonuclease [Sphingomonas sp. SUN019]UVO50961.1 ribonuclease [Sphingomonas sp. SUN019]
MPEWLYEDGIGEARAALIDDDRIVQARIELVDTAHRLGEVVTGKLTDRTIVTLDDGVEVLLDRAPSGVTQGQRMTVEIVREAIPEHGRPKRAKAVLSERDPTPGPRLRDRLDGAVRDLRAHEPDVLEAAGWSEVLDEALTGEIAFAGGALRMTPTPAMILFDVDGDGPLELLAERAAMAVAQAIVRHDIGGSIGVDFPTLAGKAPRQAVAAAIDAHLPQPSERTAMNGFGFLQIVRPRLRASLPELLRADPVASAARAALRTIERTPPTAPNTHRLPPAVRARIEARADWLADLVRRTGRTPMFDT